MAVPPFLQNCQQCKDHCGFTTAPSVAGRYCILTAQLLKIPSCLGQHSIYKCPITEATVGHAQCTSFLRFFWSPIQGDYVMKWMKVDEMDENGCMWMKVDEIDANE